MTTKESAPVAAPSGMDHLVTRLRGLLAGASEQPWVYRPDKHDDWGWIRGVERDSDMGRYRPIVATGKNSDISFEDMHAYRAAGTDPYAPNALLIAEAVNALPALLGEIQRLSAALAQPRAAMVDDDPRLVTMTVAAWEAMVAERDAALALQSPPAAKMEEPHSEFAIALFDSDGECHEHGRIGCKRCVPASLAPLARAAAALSYRNGVKLIIAEAGRMNEGGHSDWTRHADQFADLILALQPAAQGDAAGEAKG